MSRVGGIILGGVIAWLFAAAVLAVQFWPSVPQAARGWVAFVGFGPPLWLLSEVAREWYWSSRGSRTASNHASSTFRVAFGLILGSIILAIWIGLSWLFNTKV